MVIVGLTGGIGSGKSTVSAGLARRGAVIVDADAITRELQAPGGEVLAAIVERFGRGVRSADGSLDRQALADIVFHDADALADLNGIVHPAVGREIARRLGAEVDTDHFVVLDVPLLVESGRDDLGGLIVVDTDPDVATARLVEQRGFSESDARARMRNQSSREERVAKADLVIRNDGDRDALEAEIERCWNWMLTLEPAPVAAAED